MGSQSTLLIFRHIISVADPGFQKGKKKKKKRGGGGGA